MKQQLDIQYAESRGEERGLAKGAEETAKRMHNRGYDITEIAEIVGYSVSDIEKWLNLVSV